MPMADEEVNPNRDERILADSLADFATQKFGMQKPEIRFVREIAGSGAARFYQPLVRCGSFAPFPLCHASQLEGAL